MALRLKTRWHQDEGERSTEDVASALAFIGWRLAVDKAIQLHGARFHYDSDAQRLGVIQEYLAFIVQLVDRWVYERFSPEQRRDLVIGLAKRLAVHVQDNAEDLLGPGDYGAPFFALLNERAGDYAEFNFSQDDGPSYPFIRHLGVAVQHLMGQQEQNRWVIDQVMDKDGWELYQQLGRSLNNLLE